MPTVAIDLQGGFANDTVLIRCDDHEIYRREHLSTDPVTGRADAVEVEIADGAAHLDISVPSRNVTKSTALHIGGTLYVNVSLLAGSLELQTSRQPF